MRTGGGREAWGFGSMTLGNAWAFPAASQEAGLGAMRALAGRAARRSPRPATSAAIRSISFRALEPAVSARRRASVSRALALPVADPEAVHARRRSAFDAAIHDAYGKAFGRELLRDLRAARSCAAICRPISGRRSRASTSIATCRPRRARRCRCSTRSARAIRSRPPTSGRAIDDGLPEHARGVDSARRADPLQDQAERRQPRRPTSSASSASIASCNRAQAARGVTDWKYSLDFNEGCPNVGVPARVPAARPRGDARPGSIASSTSSSRPRAISQKDRANVMHEAAKLRPVVIDESLTDLDALLLAREMGYTGVALKACKGQSQAMLMAAAAQKFGMFLCVQDLTCPGASLIHSAGIAARVPGNAGIEANARQFVPAANAPWEARFPGLFTIHDGVMQTGQLRARGWAR